MRISRRDLLTSSAALAAASTTDTASSATAAPAGNDARSERVRTGGARTVMLASGHNVWVKQVGTGGIPVLTLHGGPGFNHFYLECMEDFLPAAGITFWYYDQLGCGFSDAPKDPSLWQLDRYIQEVEQVRRALALERFILYGHSWGGMLGMEYALRYPRHLHGLVVSNMTASVASYVQYAEVLLKQLPQSAQAAIARHRARGDFSAPEYQEVLMKEVYSRHVCRLDPWPEPIQRCFRFLNEAVYHTMQGPDEFNIVGNFRHWDIWARLPGVRVPTLLIGARHDEMSPAQISRMGQLISGARVVICEHGSHFAMYDDQRAYFNALVPFLHERARSI